MKKKILLIIPLAVFITAALLLAKKAPPSNNQTTSTTTLPSPKIETKIPDNILMAALNLYSQKKSMGADLSSGPCLGMIETDWVLDIAHNPRQSVDDKTDNQCAEFKDGIAHHFIELDTEGKLIQAR